ncbi:hypothetical protein Tco_1425787 [Tanacetum coccineum]
MVVCEGGCDGGGFRGVAAAGVAAVVSWVMVVRVVMVGWFTTTAVVVVQPKRGGAVAAAGWWWRGGGASGGEWHRGSGRSGDENYFWFWSEISPENFSGGGDGGGGGGGRRLAGYVREGEGEDDVKVGDGSRVSFWDDRWVGGVRLRDRFPRLYHLDRCKAVKVAGLGVWGEERLPVKVELDKKGIDLHSVLCPMCDNACESIDHGIVLCSEVIKVWSLVFGWWHPGNVNAFTTYDMLNHNGGGGMSSKI